MNDTSVLILVVIGFAVCFGLLILAIVAGGVLIAFLGISLGKHRHERIKALIEEWARDNGCEVLQVGHLSAKASPVGRKLMARGVGLVQSVEVRDDQGRTRLAWMSILGQKVGTHYSGFREETFEVVWDR